jgi:hypothetical protein
MLENKSGPDGLASRLKVELNSQSKESFVGCQSARMIGPNVPLMAADLPH